VGTSCTCGCAGDVTSNSGRADAHSTRPSANPRMLQVIGLFRLDYTCSLVWHSSDCHVSPSIRLETRRATWALTPAAPNLTLSQIWVDVRECTAVNPAGSSVHLGYPNRGTALTELPEDKLAVPKASQVARRNGPAILRPQVPESQGVRCSCGPGWRDVGTESSEEPSVELRRQKSK
jgi:hypothetical protein